MGQDKHSLISEKKMGKKTPSNGEAATFSLRRLMPSQTLTMATFEGKASQCIAEYGIMWYRASFWPAQVSCPDCVWSQLLVHYQPSHWEAE